MTTTYDPNDLLMGAGGRSAKFEHEQDVVVGFVTRTDTRQRTDIGTGHPMTWPDGNPRMQLVVTLETELHEDDDDDGMRNLYIAIPSQMQKAVADAVRKSGQRGIAPGGKLGVRFVSTAAPTQKGFNGQKQYTAKYEAPQAVIDGYDDEEEPPTLTDSPF